MPYIISQIWVFIFGAAAIWFVSRKEKWKRWGFIFGILSQPIWIYEMVEAKRWGMAALSLWYTYSWGQGIYNYFIRKEK